MLEFVLRVMAENMRGMFGSWRESRAGSALSFELGPHIASSARVGAD